MDLLPEEHAHLEEHGRCTRCGHLNALHDKEDEGWCLIDGCEPCSPTVPPELIADYKSYEKRVRKILAQLPLKDA